MAEKVKSCEEILEYIEEENIRFIRLIFFDIFGVQKNVSIMPGELERAMTQGISFDASAVDGFGGSVRSDLFLRPDPSTICIVPWQPSAGRVCRMFCDICYPDGTPFERDTRRLLKEAVRLAREEGMRVRFGPEVEFYLFRRDENGAPTKEPVDHAGYMAAEPEDRGEDLRRDVCFALLDMGITPEASHHEQGPGQNEIDFRYGDPVISADNAATFKWAVQCLAESRGCYADFSPKPLREKPGNGMHLNMSLECGDGKDRTLQFMAGVMRYIRDITLFLNPVRESYERFGQMEAPLYISWSEQNRSQLIRIPADHTERARFELRSPDPAANPYLAFALLIHAGLEGVRRHMTPELPMNVNLYQAEPDFTQKLSKLPSRIAEAAQCACGSEFVASVLPEGILEEYVRRAGV